MKRAIVTGATGDIGVALAENLAANGVEVLALARKNSARAANIPRSPLVRVEECDLSELKELSFGEKYDVFFHLGWQGSYGASRNDCRMQADNISYTLCAVEAAADGGEEVLRVRPHGHIHVESGLFHLGAVDIDHYHLCGA